MWGSGPHLTRGSFHPSQYLQWHGQGLEQRRKCRVVEWKNVYSCAVTSSIKPGKYKHVRLFASIQSTENIPV